VIAIVNDHQVNGWMYVQIIDGSERRLPSSPPLFGWMTLLTLEEFCLPCVGDAA
jgi:hypothetical protein